MKIYIVERNSPYEWVEPQVYLDGKAAVADVRREYEAQLEELGTSQQEAESGLGSCGCYWMIFEDICCGDCLIDRETDGDQWQWRITSHVIETA